MKGFSMLPYSFLNVDFSKSRYQVMIGTGGVGSGMFIQLEGNTTLGREESRGGQILARKDYCKLHIISHYVKVLLGQSFAVIPASKVGGDPTGQQLIAEMNRVGLDTRYMEISADDVTLFSVCFSYPDGSGGNLTATNAATAAVDIQSINRLEQEFMHWSGRGIALAVPEVPFRTRIQLLELGTRYQFLRVAALSSEEARSDQALGMIALTDLLAVNLDEAAALARCTSSTFTPAEICLAARDRACAVNPALQLSMTAGAQGSWNWDGACLTHTPIFPVQTVNTAGAGDAHLSGLIAGIVAGLSLAQAQQLGALTASVSVTSADTIHPDLNCATLRDFVNIYNFQLDPKVRACVVCPNSKSQENLP
jgi:sugar/nucleoside kinase (ribokinase family)